MGGTNRSATLLSKSVVFFCPNTKLNDATWHQTRIGRVMNKLKRASDLAVFYGLLDALMTRNAMQLMRDSHGRMEWPTRGVYFFCEQRETRGQSGHNYRVVRIGTHALKSGSRTTLWTRLSQHKGQQKLGGGNHRGSVFRLLVGEAIIRREKLECKSWGIGNAAPRQVRDQEIEIERKVSEYMSALNFVVLDIGDEPSPHSMRGFIERNATGGPKGKLINRLIATNQMVEHTPDEFLAQIPRKNFREPRVAEGKSVPLNSRPSLLDDINFLDRKRTLIILPCSKRKSINQQVGTAGESITNFLSSELAARLKDARNSTQKNSDLDDSNVLPAWQRYNGTLYKTAETTIQAIVKAKQPMVIISGGYGLVLADEPIGNYERRFKTSDWPAGLISDVMAAVIKIWDIEHVVAIIADSTTYRTLLASIQWQRTTLSGVYLLSSERCRGAQVKAPRAQAEVLGEFYARDLSNSFRSSDGLKIVATQLHISKK